MDRTEAFRFLYNLMAEKKAISLQIQACICQMKGAGIEDATLIRDVINESMETSDIRANREKNEARKDAIFEEFFATPATKAVG